MTAVDPIDAAILGARPSLSHVAAQEEVRSLLAALQGGCSAPVGAYASHDQATGMVHLTAAVFDPVGAGAIRATGTADAMGAASLGREIAEELLRRGAGNYITVPQARSSDVGGSQ